MAEKDTRFCYQCGHRVQASATSGRCWFCDAPLQRRIRPARHCPYCSQEIEAGARKCPHCLEFLDERGGERKQEGGGQPVQVHYHIDKAVITQGPGGEGQAALPGGGGQGRSRALPGGQGGEEAQQQSLGGPAERALPAPERRLEGPAAGAGDAEVAGEAPEGALVRGGAAGGTRELEQRGAEAESSGALRRREEGDSAISLERREAMPGVGEVAWGLTRRGAGILWRGLLAGLGALRGEDKGDGVRDAELAGDLYENCFNCGTEVLSKDNFCYHCGARLREVAAPGSGRLARRNAAPVAGLYVMATILLGVLIVFQGQSFRDMLPEMVVSYLDVGLLGVSGFVLLMALLRRFSIGNFVALAFFGLLWLVAGAYALLF